MTMTLRITDHRSDHFTVAADEPMRIEVSLVAGRIVAHAYHGADVDMEQEPTLTYDGTEHAEMHDMTRREEVTA